MMKRLCVLIFLMCSAAAQADVKLLVEFDGEEHKITRVQKIDSPIIIQPFFANTPKTPQQTAVLSYQKGDDVINIELKDPRVFRAPMSKDGKGHKVMLQNKGVYTIRVKDDDIDLKTISLQLPNKKAKTQLKYAVIQ